MSHREAALSITISNHRSQAVRLPADQTQGRVQRHCLGQRFHASMAT
jgi:hypothetical protein